MKGRPTSSRPPTVGQAFGTGVRVAVAWLAVFLITAVAATPAGAASNDSGNAVALQRDGKIVVVGGCECGGRYGFAVARYQSDGSLDPAFSGDGRTTTRSAGITGATDVAIQPDGKIVVVGYNGGELGRGLIVRYRRNGSLDRRFSKDGRQILRVGSSSVLTSVAIQSDRRIVVAGYAVYARGGADFVVARYKRNGALDRRFGRSGITRTDFGRRQNDLAYGVALQSNGKILAVGDSGVYSQGTGPFRFAIARYSRRGILDRTFERSGQPRSLGTGHDHPRGVLIQVNGHILVGGDHVIARFTPGGALDTAYGNAGITAYNVGSSALDFALQSDEKLVAVGGDAGDSRSDFSSARYAVDGSLDTSFGVAGEQRIDLGGQDQANAVAVQPDGKIIIAGRVETAPDFADFGLARLLPDGSSDSSFGTNGELTTNFPVVRSGDQALRPSAR